MILDLYVKEFERLLNMWVNQQWSVSIKSWTIIRFIFDKCNSIDS